jgi:glycosyltransferase involved in cell wall biosynthesis
MALPNAAPVVLMVSALITSKRVLEGIRVIAAIDDAFLVVAGDGPMRNEVDELCAELLPGRHRRLTVHSAQMPDLYRSADVLLHMSQTESFGNIYIEALCCGLPVVAHDAPVTRWILGHDHPGLVDTDDLAATTVAVSRALDAGRAAVAPLVDGAAARFSWPTVCHQYDQFLGDVVSQTSN